MYCLNSIFISLNDVPLLSKEYPDFFQKLIYLYRSTAYFTLSCWVLLLVFWSGSLHHAAIFYRHYTGLYLVLLVCLAVYRWFLCCRQLSSMSCFISLAIMQPLPCYHPPVLRCWFCWVKARAARAALAFTAAVLLYAYCWL